MEPLHFFSDPILRAPTWATLFMCISASLMGVVLFLKKRVLVAESLSHATYPGVVLGVCLVSILGDIGEGGQFFLVCTCAIVSSMFGLKLLHWLEEKQKKSSDAALCFVLAFFFGVGVLETSLIQTLFPTSRGLLQTLLFGQAASLTDPYIFFYGGLTLGTALFFSLFFRPIQALLFDPLFARSLPIRGVILEKILFWLLLFSIVVGIRSVGVVLISSMVIAPAIAARQWTQDLKKMFCLAALFGALSGLLGNMGSVLLSIHLSHSSQTMTLPTGPSIVCVGSFFALFSLLFAPQRGWIFRLKRMGAFRLRTLEENILKALWKKEAETFAGQRKGGAFAWALFRLWRQGWVQRVQGIYRLTPEGKKRAGSIVRLHRLWELYLSQTLKIEGGFVHQNAEEMEHVLTPDLEERLTRLLFDPKQDPHAQPIPERVEGI